MGWFVLVIVVWIGFEIFIWYNLGTDARRAWRFTIWTIFAIFNGLNVVLLKDSNLETMVLLIVLSTIIAVVLDRTGNYIIKVARDIIESNRK